MQLYGLTYVLCRNSTKFTCSQIYINGIDKDNVIFLLTGCNASGLYCSVKCIQCLANTHSHLAVTEADSMYSGDIGATAHDGKYNATT